MAVYDISCNQWGNLHWTNSNKRVKLKAYLTPIFIHISTCASDCYIWIPVGKYIAIAHNVLFSWSLLKSQLKAFNIKFSCFLKFSDIKQFSISKKKEKQRWALKQSELPTSLDKYKNQETSTLCCFIVSDCDKKNPRNKVISSMTGDKSSIQFFSVFPP